MNWHEVSLKTINCSRHCKNAVAELTRSVAHSEQNTQALEVSDNEIESCKREEESVQRALILSQAILGEGEGLHTPSPHRDD